MVGRHRGRACLGCKYFCGLGIPQTVALPLSSSDVAAPDRRRVVGCGVRRAPGAEPPTEPAPGVADRLDLAGCAGVVNELHRDGLDPQACPGEGHQGLGLDLEMRGSDAHALPGGQLDEAEAALGIGQVLTDENRDAPAHPTVDLAPQPRHGGRPAHAVTYHQRGSRFLRAGKEGGNVRRRMLPIAVQSECPAMAGGQGAAQAAIEGAALAGVGGGGQDDGAGLLRRGGGGIGRAVVDDQRSGEVSAHVGDQGPDRPRFVKAGDHGSTEPRPIRAIHGHKVTGGGWKENPKRECGERGEGGEGRGRGLGIAKCVAPALGAVGKVWALNVAGHRPVLRRA